MVESDQIGPLPESDRPAELERESFAALQALFGKHADKLLFRDERAEDVGVDASVELIVEQRYTNFRAQLQLKAVDKASYNSDGSVSLSVATKNLNYLLNGPSSFYVLFVRATNELRFAWARDERQRLDSISPDWPTQKSVTLRFQDCLTDTTIPEICERIRAAAQLDRAMRDTLARSTLGERIRVEVDPDTLKLRTPDEAYEILLESGCAITGSGYPTAVLEMAKLLDSERESDPKIQLCLAYARFLKGDFPLALGHIASTKVRLGELSQSGRSFAETLNDAVEHQTGIIDSTEYGQRCMARAASAQGADLLVQRFEAIRVDLIHNANLDRRSTRQAELEELADDICASPDIPEAQKIEARLAILFVDTAVLVAKLVRLSCFAKMRRETDLGPSQMDRAAVEQLNADRDAWEAAIEVAIRDAEQNKHPVLMADALTTRAFGRISFVTFLRQQSISAREPISLPESVLGTIETDCKTAADLYESAKITEGFLRVRTLIADLCVLRGDIEGARKIGQEVLPVACALNHTRTAKRAEELVSGNPWILRLEQEAKVALHTDSDVYAAAMTDEQIDDFAMNIQEAFAVPHDRLAVIERDIRASKQASLERLQWCRHLDLLQDLRHTMSRETMFVADPDRRCRCEKHGFETSVITTDAQALIRAFKETYCADCPDREPKQK